MNITDALKSSSGRPARKRVGRGTGSGNGKTSGRGHKGAKSRSGWSQRYSSEGGQMPIMRRLPKRGFRNIFKVRYDVVNLAQLDASFESGETVDVEAVRSRLGLKCRNGRLKVLGRGEVTKKLALSVHGVSSTAQKKVEAVGGTVNLLEESKKGRKATSGKVDA